MAGGGVRLPRGATVGQNPPAGAVIYYHLKSKPSGEVTIEILDASGKSIKKFTSKAPAPGRARPTSGGGRVRRQVARPARSPAETGLNRFVWDLRYPDATRFPGMILWSGNTRARAPRPALIR